MFLIYSTVFKPIFDFFFSFFFLILFSPFFIFVALLIKLDSKGPVFFTQERIGLNFNKFNLIKFRTMTTKNSGLKITTNSDNRITKIGKILRKFKLDELPQLVNILKLEMSFVGPRPEVEEYVNVALNDYKVILNVRPGLTDYAAIEFRDEGKMLDQFEDKEKAYLEQILPKKIACYKKYISDISLLNDLKIVFKTFVVIIRG